MIDTYWRLKNPLHTYANVHSGTLACSTTRHPNRLGAFILLCKEMTFRDGMAMQLQLVRDEVTNISMHRYVAVVQFDALWSMCHIPQTFTNEKPHAILQHIAVAKQRHAEIDAAFSYYLINLSRTVSA